MADRAREQRSPSPGGARTQLIEKALEMIDSDHPEDLSIREVARRAGVSSGAPYHHFKDKTELLAACAVVAWGQLCDALDATPRVGSAQQQLRERSATYLAYAIEHPGPYRLMTSRLLDDTGYSAEVTELRGRAMNGVVEILGESELANTEAGALKDRGVAVWSLLHGHAILRIERSLPPEAVSSERIAELAARMALLPND